MFGVRGFNLISYSLSLSQVASFQCHKITASALALTTIETIEPWHVVTPARTTMRPLRRTAPATCGLFGVNFEINLKSQAP